MNHAPDRVDGRDGQTSAKISGWRCAFFWFGLVLVCCCCWWWFRKRPRSHTRGGGKSMRWQKVLCRMRGGRGAKSTEHWSHCAQSHMTQSHTHVGKLAAFCAFWLKGGMNGGGRRGGGVMVGGEGGNDTHYACVRGLWIQGII